MKLAAYRTYTLLALVLLIISSCAKEVATIQELDANNITAYIKQNNLDVQQYNSTGLYYKIISPGKTKVIANSDQIAMVYTIHSLDYKYNVVDTVFLNRYANFAGYLVPEGLRVGVVDILKKTDGEIRLIIPSNLAYGRNGNTKVEGNESLDIDVKVIDQASIAQYDDGVIKNFLKVNNLTGYTKLPSGVYYNISSAGTTTGVDQISDESQLSLTYTGKLTDGRLFDSNTAAVFYLEDLINGWRQTLPMLKTGGTIRILVPSSQAYGFKGSGTIPPFACLDFEITVVGVSNQ